MTRMSDNEATPRASVPEWTLGWRLQRALDFAHIKAGDMADELEVTRSTVSRWMHDSGAPPRSVYVRRWAELCQVPYEWLAGDEAAVPTSRTASSGSGTTTSGWSGRTRQVERPIERRRDWARRERWDREQARRPLVPGQRLTDLAA